MTPRFMHRVERRPRRPSTPKERRRAKEMYAEGKTLTEIAAELDRTITLVSYWCKGRPSYPNEQFRRKALRSKDPMVRALYEAVHAAGLNYATVCERAGIAPQSLTCWFRGVRGPTLPLIVAAWGALGYELVPTRIEKEPTT